MKRGTRWIGPFFALMLLAVACNRTEEATVGPTAPLAPTTVDPAAQAVEEPTLVPSPTEAAEPTTQPTAAPTATPAPEPTAEPTPQPTPVPVRYGVLRFRDNGDVPAGKVLLLLNGVPDLPSGAHYELWLVDKSFNVLNLGAFEAAATVEYTGNADLNLLDVYDGAFISIEPDGTSDDKIGPLALQGTLPAGPLVHIRQALFETRETPDGRGFLAAAREQLQVATDHAGFLQEALTAANMTEARRHAEHVVNILDGAEGARFGDLDGDGLAQNPGNGFGVRGYLEGARDQAELAAAAEDTTAEVQLHAGHVVITTGNMLGWLDQAMDEAIRVISSDTAAEAQTPAAELSALLTLAREGQDLNGDGAVAPIEGEGGLLTAYEHALNMGSVEFFAAAGLGEGDSAAAAPPDSGGGAADATTLTPAEEEPHTHSTATPSGTGNPTSTSEPSSTETEPPVELVIEMYDFEYSERSPEVPVGSVVTWVNRGTLQHSATADDGSFDTALIDPGQSASVTFDTPGTYPYHCTLYGEPGGEGMAAVINVVEQ